MGEGLDADVMQVSKFVVVAVLVDDSEGGFVAAKSPYYGAAAAVDVIGGADVKAICKVITALVFLDRIDMAISRSSLSVSSLLFSRIYARSDLTLDQIKTHK